ncbi:MAG TPA: response regulator transcription factor [Chitinophagales bacterium]|nr:response regulator transcription factor [Chitinophagales bacterium]HMU68897.1 response regulator transcription factor [Chitinophagales bacterium]HMX04960.1 response regulator transcription factor [Chitinophagales bacterium]HMZ87795.1 response regulator transcription factor [Chitinophagales bacterium]HNA58077.1 response regulator transcription factor [Chitinophagales bacterium]
MLNHRILVVEDEDHIRENLKLNLELEGYEVVTAADGAKAVKTFREQRFDLVILDVMLPEMDGFDVCEQIRLEDRETPILFLTAKDTSLDKIKGLKTGGDDYMTKPFNLEELLLRIINLLKRSSKAPAEDKFNTYNFGGNSVNFVTYEANGINGNVKLTNKELKLLKLLIDRKNEVVSRTLILQTVWGYDVYPSTRTIDNFILAFRKYFESDPKNPEYFHAIRGVGYKFTDKV